MFSAKYKKEIEELKENLKKEIEEKKSILSKNKELEETCTILEKQNHTLTNNLEEYKVKVSDTYKLTNYQGTTNEITTMVKELIRQDTWIIKTVNEINTLGGDVKNIAKVAEEDINALVHSAKDTSGVINDFTDSFEDLLNKVKSIENISSQINGIASQTQLLSLNASIESARAGEAGRGFTIVADEIKKLSENTTALLADIQKTVKETYNIAVKAKNQAKNLNQGKAETSAVVKEAQSSFDKVIVKVEEISGKVENLNKEGTAHLELDKDIIEKINTMK